MFVFFFCFRQICHYHCLNKVVLYQVLWAQWQNLLNHLCQELQGSVLCVFSVPSCFDWILIAVDTSVGIYPQLANCEVWPWLHLMNCVWGQILWSCNQYNRSLVPAGSALLVSFVEVVGCCSYVIWSWLPSVGSGAYWKCLWCSQGQCWAFGLFVGATKWLVVGFHVGYLEVLRKYYAANWAWLPLVPGVGPFGNMRWAEASLHFCWACGYLVEAAFQAKTGLKSLNGIYSAIWDQLLLVLLLGTLCKNYKAHWGQLLLIWGL